MQLTEQMVINHLGQPQKKQGNELIWQCPICLDVHKDNLKYNISKNVLYCFADDTHAPLICKEIYKKNQPERQYTQDTKQWMINTDEYILYWNEVNDALMENNDALNYFFEHRLINPFTIQKCGIGYDNDDRKKAKWVFPVRRITDSRLVGFEYRGWDLTKKSVWKEKDTPSCLAEIYGNKKNKYLYIVEGFLDAYLFIQSINYNNDVTVYTPSNGCGGLKKCISEVDFNNFEKVFLIMDMDEAGQKAAEDVLVEYPNIINKRLEFTQEQIAKGMNDFTDYWRAKHEQN